MTNRFLTLVFCILISSSVHAQWQRMPWPGIDINQEYLKSITCLIQVNNQLLACAENGLFVSADNGATWVKTGGLSPFFRPMTIQETDEGLFIYGTDSSIGFPYTGYVNTSKLGDHWEPAAVLPTCSSFMGFNGRFFAISYTGSFTSVEISDNAGANWQPLLDAPGITTAIARITWNHDTLYLNYTGDRRPYRSTDKGNTYQAFSALPIRGFQKGDGWFAGQLMSGGPSTNMLTDTLIYTLNEGLSWEKVKVPFSSDQGNLALYKYGNQLYIQKNQASYSPIYAFNFADESFNLLADSGAPYNTNDQSFRFGGVSGNCYIGLNLDTIYQVCNGIRVNMTSPGGGLNLSEMASWDPNELSVLVTTGPNTHTAYHTVSVPGIPEALAPVEKQTFLSPSGYAWYQDTVYSVAFNIQNCIAKYHVPTQTKFLEQVFENGVQMDEVQRTNTHLIARNYDKIKYRPLNGTVWEQFNVSNLQIVSSPSYMYYIWPNDSKLYRIGASGIPEQLNLSGYHLNLSSSPRLAAHDSILIVMSESETNPYYWDKLFLSLNSGQTFQVIDMSGLGAKQILHGVCYLEGKVFVMTALEGIYVYDPANDFWSPYSTGLLEQPNALISFKGDLLATAPNSGLYKRGVQPTYQLKGRVFLDENNNTIQDAGEPPINQIGVSTALANGVFYTLPDGSFSSATDLPIDTHRVLLTNPYLQTQPPFVVTNNANQTADFALQVPGNLRDLSVSLVATGPFRPGFETNLVARINNHLLPVNGTELSIALLGPKVTFISANPAPSMNVGDTLLVWDLGAMDLFSDTTLTLLVKTDATASLGEVLSFSASVSANEPDVNLDNNSALWTTVVVGSYDPNDKLVNQPRIFLNVQPEKARLNYTLRFQNTGTFPTAFVTLLDTLDLGIFDPSSLEWLGSSHPFEARLVEGNILKIKFPDLALAPQSESETLSQGFVSFSIATNQVLSSPRIIQNRAGIYFDYNAPVITPYATTVVDYPVAVKAITDEEAPALYPNPAHKQVQIIDPQSEQETIQLYLYNALGQLLSIQTLAPFVRSITLPNTGAPAMMIEVHTSRGVFKKQLLRI